MKQILIILGLFASITTFAQSPRIKLNQITKDTVKGSVLISSPSDSGMVYSRDFYIAYGADTVLILYGDTLAATSGIISSVLSDGVTVLGDGTTGNELKVDTATVVSTIQGLVDTLSSRGYLTANETITLSGDVTGSGTTAITATVVDDSHNHIISNVDFLQDSLTAKANASELSNYVTIAGADTITGAKTFTNTFTQSGGDANFDNGTFYVDESEDRVGIGTSSPNAKFQINYIIDSANVNKGLFFGDSSNYPSRQGILEIGGNHVFSENYSSGITYAPEITSENSLQLQNFTMQPFISLNKNLNSFYNFLILNGVKTNGYTLTDFRNAFFRNDFNSSTGTVTNSYTLEAGSPFFYSGSILPTNQYGIRIYNQGVSGITTSYGLHIDNQSGATNSYPLYIGNFTSGTLSASSGIITASSDQTLKNSDGYVENGIDKIKDLIPRYFYWKDQAMGINRQIGFYAQEVNSVIPEAAPTPNENQHWGLYDRGLIAVSVKAIQEQQAIIETQATEIEQLKTLITDLTNRLTILENN